MLVKAIAIRQPHIARLAAGEVTVEVKTWRTDFRGDLLLVSALTPRIEPAGYACAIGRLVDCRPMVRQDEKKAGKKRYPQAQAWVFEDVRPIHMFSVKPGLALFDVTVPAAGIKPVPFKKTTTAVVPADTAATGRPRVPHSLEAARQGALRPKSPGPSSTAAPQRILDVLVLDANPTVARGIQRWVLKQHRARVVSSLEQARAAIGERAPDVVVCDYEVGAETTGPFLQMLAHRHPGIRRVLYASSRAEIWQRFVDATLVHGAVVKPATREQLMTLIAN